MKAKMPIGVRILYVLLSLAAVIVAIFAVALLDTLVTAIVISVVAFIFALSAIFIPLLAKRKIMVFPLVVGILLTAAPIGRAAIMGIAFVDDKNKQQQEEDSNKIPATYHYTEHYVSAPDSSPINRAEYQERLSTLIMGYQLTNNPYRNTDLSTDSYRLASGPRTQTGRFTEALNPNYTFDISSVLSKYARTPYSQLRISVPFLIVDTLDDKGMTDTDVLENIEWSTGCFLTVYAYNDFSYVFEYYRNFSFDGINLRVSQYMYFNNYGYPEREEFLWAANCNDAFSSAYMDQTVYVYVYTKRS